MADTRGSSCERLRRDRASHTARYAILDFSNMRWVRITQVCEKA
ncbi:MAG: hypothetical protein WBB28_12350 [Crinalium sp.]